jgi:hypothetical protein
MMPIILPDNALTMQLPQPRIVITTGRHQIRGVRTERAVPDPSLVARQRALELEGLRGWRFPPGDGDQLFQVADLPDLGCVVGAAGREVLDVGGEEDARDVLPVRLELRYRD